MSVKRFVAIIIGTLLVIAGILTVTQAVEDFKIKAKQALGTEDFTVEVTDCLIAKTKDGRQYPNPDAVAKCRWYKTITIFCIPIFFILYFYSRIKIHKP